MGPRPRTENGAEGVEAKDMGPAGASLAPVHLMEWGFATISDDDSSNNNIRNNNNIIINNNFATVSPTFFLYIQAQFPSPLRYP